ncbi:MAG TPA: CoA ester lyase [Acidimicrobiia bacterium]|nr:CoA ester lyase [Acidimicrobiia bacterium]
MNPAPRRLRSLLFAPASKPDVLRKLPRSTPDAVALDLEDAVAPDGKPAAREHARDVGAELVADHPGMAVYVRVNPVPTEWFDDDMRDGLHPFITGVIVPKLETPEQLAAVVDALDANGLEQLHVLAGIESAAGVERVRELFVPPVAVAYFGAEDFVADMGGVRTLESTEVLYARSRVVLAARLAGVPVLDQVVTRLDAEDHFLADAAAGRALGYQGKLCIHPAQVALAHRSFTPSPEEVERARRLVAAYDEAVAGGHAAIAFEGQMVDEPLARHARAVIAAAIDLEDPARG